MPATPLKTDFASRADDLAQRFRSTGRVQITDALERQSAQTILECLQKHRQWNLVYQLGGKHVAAAADTVAQWPQVQRRRLEQGIHEQAREGFQYFFASVPIYDIAHGDLLPGHLFNDVFDLLNSQQMLSAVRRIVGNSSVGFADVQATRYGPGHFLTRHDDAVAGKNRVAAYVLNLTPQWRSDWGGLLQFFSEDGNVTEAWLPAFNVLNIFEVPTPHAVSIVAPFAGAQRYAITGWFRSGVDPGR